MRYVIFTDLDGTLLDDNYDYKKAESSLNKLKERKISVIFCSAKTRLEQEVIREKMGINDPFIVENGSAIYFPEGYFGERKGEIFNGYERIVLGVKFEEIKKELDELRKRYSLISYYYMSVEEVARITKLSIEDAERAKQREFGETIVECDEMVLKELRKKFNVVSGGRFIQVYGRNADKGKAVIMLKEFYEKLYNEEVISIGVGNAENDLPMLRSVDRAFLVQNPDGKWAELNLENVVKVKGIGPEGWSNVMEKYVLRDKNV